MSKQTTTRGYIISWVLYVVAWVALLMTLHASASQGTSSPSSGAAVFYFVLFTLAIAMLIFWIGALIRLGQMASWSWFVAVLVLHLVGLGIVGMLAYAVGGPEDSGVVVIRPPMAT